jgi:transcriptional regulator
MIKKLNTVQLQLDELRQLGLNQDTIAQLLGLASQSNVSRIRTKGKTSKSLAFLISTLLYFVKLDALAEYKNICK